MGVPGWPEPATGVPCSRPCHGCRSCGKNTTVSCWLQSVTSGAIPRRRPMGKGVGWESQEHEVGEAGSLRRVAHRTSAA